MTLEQVKQWASDNAIDEDKVLECVRKAVAESGMSWQSVNLEIGELYNYEAVPYGYRKITTGEYVPNIYRYRFGWKNTYYQHACLTVTIPVPGFYDIMELTEDM